MESRPSWDEYFYSIAEMVAARSTCPRLQVGSILVHDPSHAIISSGYNGAPRNQPHCMDIGCRIQRCDVHTKHCTRAVHAEENTLKQAWKYGSIHLLKAFPDELVLFSTHQPCPRCTEILEKSNITQFKYQTPYNRVDHPSWLQCSRER